MQTDNMNQSTFPNDKVRIVDVTARDGLQNEKEIVSTETRVELHW